MKKTAKLLSVLLALIMCLGIFSMAASAATINEIKIKSPFNPIAFEDATWDWSVPTGATYNKVSSTTYPTGSYLVESSTRPSTWSNVQAGKKIDKTAGYKYKPNTFYTFVAVVRPSTSSNTFANYISTTFNGSGANVQKEGLLCFVWYTPAKTASLIESLSVTGVTAPVANTTAKWAFNATSPNGEVNPLTCWWVETDTKPTTYSDVEVGHFYKQNNGDFNFKPGKYYTVLTFLVTSQSDYVFSDSTTAKLNGKNANFRISIIDGDLVYYSGFVWYTFDKTASTPSATLTGIEIVSTPKQTEYTYKSGTSTDGLKVNAKYSDGTTKDVTNEVNVAGFNATNNKKGNYTATVEYQGKTATFDYTVNYTIIQWVIMILLLGFIWY